MADPVPAVPLVASELAIPDNFRNSYNHFNDYPTSLVVKTTYPAALEASKKRLHNSAAHLLSDGASYVVFRDFKGDAPDGGLERDVIRDEGSLQRWLGAQASSMPLGGFATKKDPKCRYMFINANSSRDPLKITQSMLASICTYHQVMPAYLDFLVVFGTKAGARELRFGGFREQSLITNPPRGLFIESLGRSGRQYQLCYNLKAVTCKSEPGTSLLEQDWSIRQAAIHHQFDVVYGTTVWIITQGHPALKNRIIDMTALHGRPEDRAFTSPGDCFRTSLATHILNCHWSIEEWRWYVQWQEEVNDRETEVAIYGTRNRVGQYVYTPAHVQMVQLREDKINVAIMVMEANADILSSLRNFYQRLAENQNFDLRKECEGDIVIFASQIDELIYDSKMQIARAKVLAKITNDRKSLILQHLQTQAAGKMEELTNLTIKIGTMTQREAIAMRIITVVTLTYLPATFVSTFFSTDIIKYQNPDGNMTNATNAILGPYNGSFSQVALERWLQITIPLTCLTLLAGWVAFKMSGIQADKEFEEAQRLPTYENVCKDDVIV